MLSLLFSFQFRVMRLALLAVINLLRKYYVLIALVTHKLGRANNNDTKYLIANNS